MMNSKQSGCVMHYVASADIKGGDVVKMGGCIGVTVTDIANGDTGSVAVCGVFDLPKASGAITQGAAVYLTSAGKIAATSASGSVFAGVAFEGAASGDATVAVNINFGSAPAA